MKKLFSALVSLAITVSLIPSAMAETETGYNVVWAGGSYIKTSTAMESEVENFLKDKLNETSINSFNAGMSDVTSSYGRLCYEDNVIAKNPDLIFINYLNEDSKRSFDGNYPQYGSQTSVSYALESMVRRTIANNADTKIVFLLTPGDYKGASQSYKDVAYYYGIPVIDAMNSANVAETIKDYLRSNTIYAPMAKKYPMAADYTPVVPTSQKASEITGITLSGFAADQDGNLTSSNQGNSVTYKFKGTVIGVTGPNPQTDVNAKFTVDGLPLFNFAGGALTSTYNGVMINEIQLPGDSETEHTLVISNENGVEFKFTNIIVDGVANGLTSAGEIAQYSVYNDPMNSASYEGRVQTFDSSNVQTTGWQANFDGILYGINKLTYKPNMETTQEIASVVLTTNYESASPKANSAEDDITMYAINRDGTEKIISHSWYTKRLYPGVTDLSGRRTDERFAYNIPADTVGIRIENKDGVKNRFDDVKIVYGTPAVEKIELSAESNRVLIGAKGVVTANGILNNGTKKSISGVTYYSNNSEILTINSETGEFTAIAAGTAIVYASYESFEASIAIEVVSGANVESAYIKADKTNYTKGTSGKFNLYTVEGGVVSENAYDASYTSSDPNVIEIQTTGEFTAKNAGTCVISANTLLQAETKPVTVTVFDNGEVSHEINDEVTNGIIPRHVNNKDLFKDDWGINEKQGNTFTGDLLGYVRETALNSDASGIYAYAEIASKFAFIYKIPKNTGCADVTFTVNNSIKDKVLDGAYAKVLFSSYSDDNTFYDAAYSQDITVSGNMTSYGFKNFAYGDSASWWKKGAETRTQNGSYNSFYSYINVKVNNIPANSDYMLILIDTNADTSFSAVAAKALHCRLKNVSYTTKPEIVNAARLSDGTYEFTFNRNINLDGATISAAKNGANIDTLENGSYDSATYTYRLKVGEVNLKDRITFSIANATDSYGMNVDISYTDVITDERGRVESLSATDQNGTEFELTDETTKLIFTSRVVNSNAQYIRFIAAQYDEEGTLKKTSIKDVDVSNKNAEATVSLELETVKPNDKVKIFIWADNMAPVPVYDSFVTEFVNAF